MSRGVSWDFETKVRLGTKKRRRESNDDDYDIISFCCRVSSRLKLVTLSAMLIRKGKKTIDSGRTDSACQKLKTENSPGRQPDHSTTKALFIFQGPPLSGDRVAAVPFHHPGPRADKRPSQIPPSM